jgi:hypothetical protein
LADFTSELPEASGKVCAKVVQLLRAGAVSVATSQRLPGKCGEQSILGRFVLALQCRQA